MPDADSPLRHYPETILRFAGAAVPPVDLRKPLEAPMRRALASLDVPPPFAVLTAENPDGAHADDQPPARAAEERARNARRSRSLVEELTMRRVPWVRVDGSAPDGSHLEHCVAAALGPGEAVSLARDFSQLALFWYDGTRFWLLGAEASTPPVALPPGESGEAASPSV